MYFFPPSLLIVFTIYLSSTLLLGINSGKPLSRISQRVDISVILYLGSKSQHSVPHRDSQQNNMFVFSCFLFFDIKTAPFAGAETALNWGQAGLKENGSTNLSQNGSVDRGADSLSYVGHMGIFIDAATVSLGLIQTKLTKWPCMESNQLHGPYSRIGTLGLNHFLFKKPVLYVKRSHKILL